MSQAPTIQNEEVKLQEGLTVRSLLGIIFAAVVLQPAVIFMSYVSGVGLTGAIQYITTLLFVEMARTWRYPLTKQETFIIWQESMVTGLELLAPSLIWNAYFRSSPITNMFGISNLIPSWYAPPPDSMGVRLRSFAYPEWIIPILLTIVTAILTRITDFSMGLLTIQLYSEVEKLPFPMARPGAEACLTLAERDRSKMKIFTFSALIGAIYAIFLYGFPIVTGGAAQILPIPWFDFNNIMEMVLPGGSFGVATDITAFASAFVIPPDVLVYTILGSFAFYLVGNPIMVQMGIFKEWTQGFSLTLTYQRSVLYIWSGPIIGLALAAALMPLLRHPEFLTRTFRSLRRLPEASRRAGFLPLTTIMLLYLVSRSAMVAISSILVPAFPIWILILITIVLPFVMTLVSARAIAETGFTVEIPYVREVAILGSGYEGIDIWFAPIAVGTGGAGWCNAFKICLLTETKPSSMIKAYFIAAPLAWLMSFVYVSAFWSIAPIPSMMYPWTVITWPINAVYQNLWVTRMLEVFRPIWILTSFSTAAIIYLVADQIRFPFSLIGLVAGTGMPIPNAVSLAIGLLTSKMFERVFGKEWWLKYRAVILAGLIGGEGIVIGFAATIYLIIKFTWILPY